MNRKEIIEVEVTNFFLGSMVPLNDQTIFLAVERAPGIYRVNDGTYDFTFTSSELDDGDLDRPGSWIRRIDG